MKSGRLPAWRSSINCYRSGGRRTVPGLLGVKIKTPFRFAVALSVKAKQKQSWDALLTHKKRCKARTLCLLLWHCIIEDVGLELLEMFCAADDVIEAFPVPD